jgi:ABC-type glycerol-3-phosphate transport system substrate-binding protein
MRSGHTLSSHRFGRRTLLGGAGSALALSATGGLAACSGGKGLPGDEVENPAGGEEVTLQWWTNHTSFDEKLFKEAISRYRKVQPGTTVKLLNVATNDYYTKIKTAAVGQKLPDIFYVRTFDTASNAAKGWNLSLAEFVEKDPEGAALDDILDVQLAQMTYQDELYAMPYNMSDFGVYFNKAMFAEAGVPEPTNDWTWDDLWAAAAEFPQRDGKRQTRWGVNVTLSDWFMIGVLKSMGGSAFTDDGTKCTIDNPQATAFLQTLQDKIKAGLAPAAGAVPAGVNPFAAGMLAMNIDGSWSTGATRDAVGRKFDWDVVKIPLGSTGKREIVPAGGAWGISANCAHPEQAWDFLKFITANEQQQLLIGEQGSVPGRVSSTATWLEAAKKKTPPHHMEVFTEQLANDTWDFLYPPYWGEFQTIFGNRITGVANNKPVPEVVRQIQDETNKAAARYA